MQRHNLFARMLVIQGALLIVAAVIHLMMTSQIGQIVARNTTPKAYAFLWPPYALDHVFVGILLFPVGLTAMLCAGGIRAGERRIWWIAFVNALAIFSMLFAIALTAGPILFRDGARVPRRCRADQPRGTLDGLATRLDSQGYFRGNSRNDRCAQPLNPWRASSSRSC
jgi:hypothetical protein